MGDDVQQHVAWLPHEAELGSHVASYTHNAGMLMALSLENAALMAALRESRRELSQACARIIDASDRGRRKLERDLHDGAQQRLTTIQVKLKLVQDAAGHDDLAAQLDSIGRDLELAAEELRGLARGIYPPVLRDQGLVAAVRSLATRAPIPVAVVDQGVGRPSAVVETAVYFCIVEAVQNATKHAGATARVTIVLRPGPPRGMWFEVTDDGRGMIEPIRAGGIGLMSMRDRIGAVGGELEIVSSPGGGTTVRGHIPSAVGPSMKPGSDRQSDRWIPRTIY